MSALRRSLDAEYVAREDFDEAFKLVKPSVSPQLVKEYQRMSELLRYTKEQLTMIG